MKSEFICINQIIFNDKIVNTKVKKYFYYLITINYHIQTITSPRY